MAGMHALHKILADKARPRRAAVKPGEYIEIEPDAYSAIVGVNAGEAKRLAADLAELGIKELPLQDRIFANADHASPAPTAAFAASQKAWRDFYQLVRHHDLRRRHGRLAPGDGGAGHRGAGHDGDRGGLARRRPWARSAVTPPRSAAGG